MSLEAEVPELGQDDSQRELTIKEEYQLWRKTVVICTSLSVKPH